MPLQYLPRLIKAFDLRATIQETAEDAADARLDAVIDINRERLMHAADID